MGFRDFITTTEVTENTEKEESCLTGKIIGATIEVHRALGPGGDKEYSSCDITGS